MIPDGNAHHITEGVRNMRKLSAAVRVAGAVIAVTLGFSGGPTQADDDDHDEHGAEAQEFIHGAPATPSDPWLLAAGGRIYDNWWEALDREEPEGTHPSYPATGEQSGPDTWRCKECHGWDYRGAGGVYRKGSHYTGIKGIEGAIGKPEAEIAALLRAPLHGYTPEMIKDDELARIAAFVSRGQVDMSTIVDGETRAIIAGDPDRGRGIFQTVCAACHGFDGRFMDWGDDGEHAYVGTEATTVPDEVLNKILNAHTGVAMVNLRAFPLDAAVDVLSYTATLPVE
jgi:thiosulfate dehydrogenase